MIVFSIVFLVAGCRRDNSYVSSEIYDRLNYHNISDPVKISIDEIIPFDINSFRVYNEIREEDSDVECTRLYENEQLITYKYMGITMCEYIGYNIIFEFYNDNIKIYRGDSVLVSKSAANGYAIFYE
ncbi:MAG: hypothetical protein AAFU51_05955 [Bacteroidota bacterium]